MAVVRSVGKKVDCNINARCDVESFNSFKHYSMHKIVASCLGVVYNRDRISSVGRAFDCRAGGGGFDSRGRTITQGLKMTEK